MALKDIVEGIKNVGRGNKGRVDLGKVEDFKPEGELRGATVVLSVPGTLGELEYRGSDGKVARRIVHLSGRG